MNPYLMYIVDFFVMICPTFGYIDTIRIMIKTRRTENYNINTVLIIFFAQGNKVLFYFFHPYATRIFGQTVCLLLAATILTMLRFLFNKNMSSAKKNNQNKKTKTLIDSEKFNFREVLNIFQAESFPQFLTILLAYAFIDLAIFIVCCKIFGIKFTVDTLGLIANLVESSTSFPTFIRVVINKDIITVSPVLIMQYISGDIMKIILFTISKTPWSFVFGGCCQLTVDTIMVFTFIRLSFNKERSKSEEAPLIKDVNLDDQIDEFCLDENKIYTFHNEFIGHKISDKNGNENLGNEEEDNL
ncbi:hypothetical protein TRFO_02498 [Tritrichomonas foetus]|uniref:PQ loop repeat family protein n=1 Tax=Tritrichomonas foetus TaxID=1144522 RepID=A0A1J4L6A5_9EUKA|nr:hypothetical protein TRFO_02498 [Tritrichomonas foetus]|eukprot:OHT17477.1 hypothetical protein TRFO_02498 [Tritrichomonas foetus]